MNMEQKIKELKQENANLREIIGLLHGIATANVPKLLEQTLTPKRLSLFTIPIAVYGFAKQHATLIIFLNGMSMFMYALSKVFV